VGKEELIRRSGIKPLSEILKARGILAGHVQRQTEDRPANVAMSWIPEDGRRPKVRPQKLGVRCSQEVCEVSEYMEYMCGEDRQ